MTIWELSKKFDLPYSTTHKYVQILADHSYIFPRKTDKGIEISESDLETFEKFLTIIQGGYKPKEALLIMDDRKVIRKLLIEISEKIDNIEERLEKIEEYIERKGFWRKFLSLFKRRR